MPTPSAVTRSALAMARVNSAACAPSDLHCMMNSGLSVTTVRPSLGPAIQALSRSRAASSETGSSGWPSSSSLEEGG